MNSDSNAAQGEGDSILLVEDEAAVRKLLERMLMTLGVKVRSAECGEDAMDLIAADSSVDLLLTDIRLPGEIGGVELAKRVADTRPGLKVLFMTGMAHVSDTEDLEFSFEVMTKPFRMEEFRETVKRLLES